MVITTILPFQLYKYLLVIDIFISLNAIFVCLFNYYNLTVLSYCQIEYNILSPFLVVYFFSIFTCGKYSYIVFLRISIFGLYYTFQTLSFVNQISSIIPFNKVVFYCYINKLNKYQYCTKSITFKIITLTQNIIRYSTTQYQFSFNSLFIPYYLISISCLKAYNYHTLLNTLLINILCY